MRWLVSCWKRAAIAMAGAVSLSLISSDALQAQARALCEAPGEACGAVVAPACLERIGAGSFAATDEGDDFTDCPAQLERYRSCLVSVVEICGRADASASTLPQSPPATPPIAAKPQTGALATWTIIKESKDPAVFDAFAADFPNTALATLARNRAKTLREDAAAQARENAAAAVWAEIEDAADPSVFEAFAEEYANTSFAARAAEKAARLRQPAERAAPGRQPNETATPEPEAAPEPDPAEIAERALNRDAQRELNRLGLDVGAPDGVWGPRSRAQLTAFQRAQGFATTGEITPDLLKILRAAAPIETAVKTPPGEVTQPEKDAPSYRALQQSEASVGASLADPEQSEPKRDSAQSYTATFDWRISKGWDTQVGRCSTEIEPNSATRYRATSQNCQGEKITYDIEINPDGGAISGTAQIFGFEGSTVRVPVRGRDFEAGGRRGGATVRVTLSAK